MIRGRGFCPPALAIAVVLGSAAAMPADAQESMAVSIVPKLAFDAARVGTDFAAIQETKSAAIFDFKDKASAELPAVVIPMFAPPELLDHLGKASAKSGGGDQTGLCGSNGAFIPHEDGYLVACAYPAYDLVIEGTSRAFATSADKASADAASVDYIEPFGESETGGTISFGYAGAHYVASFDCREGVNTCISDAAAQAVVNKLVVCALGGKCVENGTQLIKR